MTTFVGTAHYYGFSADFGEPAAPLSGWMAYFNGLWYSAAILGILGAHGMGHYVACRYYRVDASLPYFLPAIAVGQICVLVATVLRRGRTGPSPATAAAPASDAREVTADR